MGILDNVFGKRNTEFNPAEEKPVVETGVLESVVAEKEKEESEKQMIERIRKSEAINQVVKAIHAEFENASDVVLDRVYSILNREAVKDEEEVSALKNLGFNSLPQVSEYSKIQNEKTAAKQLADVVEYYKKTHPNLTFVPENELTRISQKYGLLIGRPQDYTGTIPAENRREIINFKFDDKEHMRYTLTYWGGMGRSSEAYTSYKRYNEELKSPSAGVSVSITNELKIVATSQYFNLTSKIVENNRIRDEIKDPIVLFPVMGGYIVVSKWGAEADIEEFNRTK